MSLHPDIIDAMVAAGASAGMDPGAVLAMVQAACRAAWNVSQQASPVPPPAAPIRRETPGDIAEEMRGIAAAMHALDGPVQRGATNATLHATDATLHATVQRSSTGRPQTSTQRSRKHRAAKAMQRANISAALHPVASVAPLSLIEDLDPLRERELATPATKRNVAVAPLPDDWQPDDKSKAEAAPLGEAAAAVMTANFCDYYWAHPEIRKTAAAWQSKYRTAWARKELQQLGSRQGKLPLMRRVQNRDGPSYRERWERVVQETIARRETG